LRKAADEIVNNSSTLQNDNELLWPIAANETWVVDFYLGLSNTAASAGFKAAVTWPASPTNASAFGNVPGGGTGTGGGTFTETSGNAVISDTDQMGVAYVHAYVANGANAGNITLQWAQGGAVSTDTTVEAGSYLRATRVA